jgi:hypothetical protein
MKLKRSKQRLEDQAQTKKQIPGLPDMTIFQMSMQKIPTEAVRVNQGHQALEDQARMRIAQWRQ